MTNDEVSDEMLMAYADGELDGSEREKIAELAGRDPAIARRIAGFAGTAAMARQAFASVHAEPVPSELIAAVLDEDEPSVAMPGRTMRQRAMMPLAACLVLAVGIGSYFAGASRSAPAGFLAAATGTAALETLAATPSGTPVTLAAGGQDLTLQATGTFATREGYCRLYSADGAAGSMRGLACGEGGDWTVPVSVLVGEGDYQLASESSLAVIDTYLDGVGAGPDIGDAAETELLERGWR